MHRMALNKAKLFNRSRRFRGEIGTVVSFPRYDPMAVNQRVAGSSPADGANNHKAFKDEGQSRVALFGNIIGNNSQEVQQRHTSCHGVGIFLPPVDRL
jgi:hypothetical protein